MNTGKSYAMIDVRGREKDGVIPKRMKRKRSNVDNTQNIISFCTGYGGIELGLRRAGVDVRTVVNVEIEAFCCANLGAKIEEGRMDNAPIWTDLKTFPAREFRGKVHGLIGGYPCQPFSSAGKRQGEKDPRHLWPYILKHVRAIRPVWCFWENVQGHATMGLWRVLSDLEEEGYRCTWGIFSAEEVGAPHQRKRVFILAERVEDTSCTGLQGYSKRFQSKQERIRQDRKHATKTSIHNRKFKTKHEELGNSASLRPHRGSENCEGEQSEVLGERLESDELGDTKHDGLHGDSFSRGSREDRDRGEKRKKASKQSTGASGQEDLRHLQAAELANPTSRQSRQSQARNGGQDTSGGSEEELADSERCGSAESMQLDTDLSAKPSGRDREEGQELGQTQWPARPGEEQYEWEEPRVTEAQSELGGATHGTQHRVDRLRLLGNGVVPQTAEIAWKTLWQRI